VRPRARSPARSRARAPWRARACAPGGRSQLGSEVCEVRVAACEHRCFVHSAWCGTRLCLESGSACVDHRYFTLPVAIAGARLSALPTGLC